MVFRTRFCNDCWESGGSWFDIEFDIDKRNNFSYGSIGTTCIDIKETREIRENYVKLFKEHYPHYKYVHFHLIKGDIFFINLPSIVGYDILREFGIYKCDLFEEE